MVTSPRRRRSSLVVVVLVAAALAACSSSAPAAGPTTASGASTTTASAPTTTSPASPSTAARDAFLAGYPLLVTERTIQTFAGLIGVNKLLRTAKLATDSSRFIVAPNHDTLYAIAVLDLRSGAQVLTVPQIDRYYTVQFIDAWMDTVTNVGTRQTKGEAGSWIIVPPGYKEELPAGAKIIHSPSNQLIMLGRVRAVDGPDEAAAHAATDGMTLEPYGSTVAGEGPGIPVGPTPKIPRPPGTPQTTGENGLSYYDELGDALAINPPPTARLKQVFARAAVVGIGAGKHPSTDADPTMKAVLDHARTAGLAGLDAIGEAGGSDIDGWRVNVHLGDQAASLSLHAKAVVARNYWGPNVAAESTYPVAITASDGKPLTGDKRYVIHLPGNDLPPVKAFWSYTVYGPDSFFIKNPINRWSISGQTAGLQRGADGSIDIYLGATAPAGHEANWLPTPSSGPYKLVMRLYLPGPAILDGTYHYPPVTVLP